MLHSLSYEYKKKFNITKIFIQKIIFQLRVKLKFNGFL
jgi:hypothetical protein